jgi:hypothetical protein
MQKWEYKCLNANKIPGMALENKLNEYGREGWEVVCMTLHGKDHGYVTLKRPLS